MTMITSLLQSAVESIVPLAVLLGLLIAIHELGHFLVAKYFKVRVEVFSLGFGPKLLKFKRGETTYTLSAIPLGGYVKMFGDDPTAVIDADQQKYSFTHKPVGQRIAVVLAGPIMNFLFAIVLFAMIATIGEDALTPQVGDVAATTPAFAQGFREGDLIKSIAGEEVKTFDDVDKKIEANGDHTVAVDLVRDGKPVSLQITPKMIDNKNQLSWDERVGEVDGLSPSSKSSFIGVSDPNSPAAKAGLKSGDHIVKINGTALTKWRELTTLATGKITFEAERGKLDEKTTDHPEIIKGTVEGADLKAMGIEYPELYLAAVSKDSPASKAGLLAGDRLISIDGTPVKSFEQIASLIRAYGDKVPKSASQGFIAGLLAPKSETSPVPLNVVYLRDGQEKQVALSPIVKKRMDNQGNEDRRYEIGISPLIVDALPGVLTMDFSKPFGVIARGVDQTVKWSSLTFLSFVRLFQGRVSPKNVGGFFSIGAMAKKSWSMGITQYLHVMAIISINLFVLNLFPVPVLDGGHLVFYAIELVKGAPLSMRKMEIAQQVGLVLLLGLMVFALFNDATRFIFN